MTAPGAFGLDPPGQAAPPWATSDWFNHDGPLELADLRGRVVVLHAFQMLCPGCMLHGLPQAQRIRAAFDEEQVAVVGLHTVFEHHAAMTPVSLAAFLHEFRVTFAVGVDAAEGTSGIPRTMRAYGLRGTPSLALIDRRGDLRCLSFGVEDDLLVGAAIATLMGEAR